NVAGGMFARLVMWLTRSIRNRAIGRHLFPRMEFHMLESQNATIGHVALILRKLGKLGRMCCENIQNATRWTRAILLLGKLAPLESLSSYLQSKPIPFRLTQC